MNRLFVKPRSFADLSQKQLRTNPILKGLLRRAYLRPSYSILMQEYYSFGRHAFQSNAWYLSIMKGAMM